MSDDKDALASGARMAEYVGCEHQFTGFRQGHGLGIVGHPVLDGARTSNSHGFSFF